MNKQDSLEELHKKIRGMNSQELSEYLYTANSATRLVSVVGIACLLAIIYHPSILTIAPGAILIWILASVGAVLDTVIKLIETEMKKFDK